MRNLTPWTSRKDDRGAGAAAVDDDHRALRGREETVVIRLQRFRLAPDLRLRHVAGHDRHALAASPLRHSSIEETSLLSIGLFCSTIEHRRPPPAACLYV